MSLPVGQQDQLFATYRDVFDKFDLAFGPSNYQALLEAGISPLELLEILTVRPDSV